MSGFTYHTYIRDTKKPQPITKAEREHAAWGYAAIKEEAPELIRRAVKRRWVGFHGVLGMEQ